MLGAVCVMIRVVRFFGILSTEGDCIDEDTTWTRRVHMLAFMPPMTVDKFWNVFPGGSAGVSWMPPTVVFTRVFFQLLDLCECV